MEIAHKKEKSGFLQTVSDCGFEGPEKVLEVDFVPVKHDASLRTLSRKVWDSVLNLARCQILSEMSNEFCDSYVLSESSLFVYPYKVFIKTCGTTTLLRMLPELLKETKSLGLELQWIGYTRKNYTFPGEQEFPHGSFKDEISYTKQCYGNDGEPLKGGAYVLGDVLNDHWFVYVADYCEETVDNSERNINIMMYGLDEDVAAQFFRRPGNTLDQEAERVREETGIRSLCPNAMIDDAMFDPCGYSMNALDGETFYTIHVTPEREFSYASFETNLELPDYSSLISQVVSVFHPQRFVITVFADESALAKIKTCPTTVTSLSCPAPVSRDFDSKLSDESLVSYRRQTQSATSFREDYACRMSVYTSV